MDALVTPIFDGGGAALTDGVFYEAGDGSIQAAGIASAEAFGAPVVGAVVGIVSAGIPSAEAIGLPSLSAQVSATGLASAEAFGTPFVGEYTIACVGIESGEAIGQPTVGLQSRNSGRSKRKGNPFLRADFTEKPKDREPEPALAKGKAPAQPKPAPKASGLLLGLLERAAAVQAAPAPEPVASVALQRVVDAIVAVASAPKAPPPAPAAPAPAPAPAPDATAQRLDRMEGVVVERIAQLEATVDKLLQALALTLPMGTLPELQHVAPVPVARGLAIDPEPLPDDDEPPAMSREAIAAENKRRARILARRLLDS